MYKILVSLLCIISCALAASRNAKLPLAAQQSLVEFMLQTRDISQEHPARSLDCFQFYIPILNGITAEYEASYATCLKSADEGYEKIDSSTMQQRGEIENDAKAACGALANCAGYANSIDYFGCFSTEGSYNSRVMYNISANSGEILINVRELYRLIETDRNRCTNASERAYVENTANTYEEMQMCLQGKAPVPQTTDKPSTTSEPAPTDTTVPEARGMAMRENFEEFSIKNSPNYHVQEEKNVAKNFAKLARHFQRSAIVH